MNYYIRQLTEKINLVYGFAEDKARYDLIATLQTKANKTKVYGLLSRKKLKIEDFVTLWSFLQKKVKTKYIEFEVITSDAKVYKKFLEPTKSNIVKTFNGFKAEQLTIDRKQKISFQSSKKTVTKMLLLILIPLVMGCSLIPRVTFDSKGATADVVNKGKAKEVCKGKATWNEQGDIVSCSKGYYSYQQNFIKKERKYTFTEKVKNIINGFAGWGFWGLVILVILCPSLLGLIVGRVFNSANSVVDQLVRSIGKFRKTSAEKEALDDILRAETDNNVKKIIAQKRVTLK